MDRDQKLGLIYQVFSPSAPIEDAELFIGRIGQISKIRDAISERGQHAVMYGGRGVGKTSLSNVMSTMYSDMMVLKITCNRTDDFRSIWEKALSKISVFFDTKKIGYQSESESQAIELSLPDKQFIDPSDIEQIVSSIQSPMLFIFDEFDSIEDRTTKMMMSDMLKSFSDNLPQVTLLIVGIGQSVDELLGDHPSLERCIKQVFMPLMSKEETAELIANSLEMLDLEIEEPVLNKIIEISSGFPHYTHLLSKFATREAISDDFGMVNDDHLQVAVRESIDNSSYSIRADYERAIAMGKNENQFKNVILACALVNASEKWTTTKFILGKYCALINTDTKIESIQYNLGMLCKAERGEILVKNGKSEYQFRNPLMKAFVKLNSFNQF